MNPGERSEFPIREAAGPADIAVVRALFGEYAAWLQVDLCFQGFAEELAALPGRYAPPDGRLLLAWSGDIAAGCVALRRLDADSGEVKRLYVRPAFRGQGLGRALTETLVESARRIGYGRIVLDTLACMPDARRLYADMGFREIPRYYDNPIPGTTYLELPLRDR
jgi:putative acetyltransferase